MSNTKPKNLTEQLQETSKRFQKALAQSKVDRDIFRDKIPTGEVLQKELEALRNVEKPNNIWAWFKKMKHVGPRVGFLHDPLVKRLQRPFKLLHNKFMFANLLGLYLAGMIFFPPTDRPGIETSFNYYPHGLPPKYDQPGVHLSHLIHEDLGQPKRHKL